MASKKNLSAFTLSLWMLIVPYSNAGIFNSLKCMFIAREAGKENVPFKAQSILAKHGLDVEKVSFKIGIDPGRMKQDLFPFARLELFYEGEPLLVMSATKDQNSTDRVYVETSNLLKHQGAGLGSLAYLVLARHLHRELQFTLNSDQHGATSTSAKAVWSGFVENGYATQKAGILKHFKFDETVFDQPKMWEEIDSILNNQTEQYISTKF